MPSWAWQRTPQHVVALLTYSRHLSTPSVMRYSLLNSISFLVLESSEPIKIRCLRYYLSSEYFFNIFENWFFFSSNCVLLNDNRHFFNIIYCDTEYKTNPPPQSEPETCLISQRVARSWQTGQVSQGSPAGMRITNKKLRSSDTKKTGTSSLIVALGTTKMGVR